MSNSEFRHGFDPKAWELAKKQAREVLYERAIREKTITYSDLVAKIGAIRLDPHDIRLGHFLGEISEEDDENGLGLTTVIVVHKNGDLMPGPGFYDLAESRGRNTSKLEECWIMEMNAVFDYWSRTKQRP